MAKNKQIIDTISRIKNISEVQRLFLHLILLSSFGPFNDSADIVFDLLECRESWAAVIPWNFWTGQNKHPLIPLRSMASASENHNRFNANALFIVPRSFDDISSLQALASKWNATCYEKSPEEASTLMGGPPDGAAPVLLMMVLP